MTREELNVTKKNVLVTRPQARAAEFIDLLNDHGFKALAFASIEIQPVKLNSQLEKQLKLLNQYDCIIFISVNAVEQVADLLRQLNIKPVSVTTKIATIGKSTMKAANQAGFKVTMSPQSGFNSESLLALNALQREQINGARCLIIRGVGGMETLADTLSQRGAQVEYAEVYRREIPSTDKNISRQQLSEQWQSFKINAITVTSNESLQNLYDMLEPPGQLAMLKTNLIVASRRGVSLANKLGFKSVICAQSALNQHMLAALKMNLKQ